MRRCSIVFCQIGLFLFLAACPLCAATSVQFWLTTEDLAQKMAVQSPLVFSELDHNSHNHVELDEAKRFQTILGFGSSLEPTTCSNFWRMAATDREALMERIVEPKKGIGMN